MLLALCSALRVTPHPPADMTTTEDDINEEDAP